MKRLLIIEDAVEMGGVQYSTINLLLGLKTNTEYQPLVLIPGEGTFTQECRKHGILYKIYPKTQMFSSSVSIMNDKFRIPNIPGLVANAILSRKEIINLITEIQEFNPNVVITKGMWAHINGGRACRRLGVPCIWHQQDFISERYRGLFKMWFGYLAKYIPTYIIADGSPIRQQLPVSVQKKCEVIFNGVPLDNFYQPEKKLVARTELNIPKEAYVIGHVGRMTPWKGQHILLEAFIQYAQKNPSSYLLLIGSPLFYDNSYFESLKKRIAASGLTDRVCLPGYRSDLGYLLSAIDTFIYPSVEKDTSPLALISALAAGLPIGVSDISGLKEMIEDFEGVMVFENKNIDQILAIIHHFESKEIRKIAGDKNRLCSVSRFSLDSYVNNTIDVSNKILAK